MRVVSRHFLRRRARAVADEWSRRAFRAGWDTRYKVARAERGPHRWFVVSYFPSNYD